MPVRPVAKSAYVCDDVVSDPRSRKVSLLNLWDTMRIPEGKRFPYCLEKVKALVWWRSGFGNARTRLEIVQASSGEMIRRTRDITVSFGDRSSSVYALYKIQECVFPEPGIDFLEVFCEGEFVDDQVIRVISHEG
jgi:hypothetical protein